MRQELRNRLVEALATCRLPKWRIWLHTGGACMRACVSVSVSVCLRDYVYTDYCCDSTHGTPRRASPDTLQGCSSGSTGST